MTVHESGLSDISDIVKRKNPICEDVGDFRQCNMDFRDRIAARIDALETNPSAVSLKIGRGRTLVTEILNGKSKDPGIYKIAEIAKALETTVAYITGETDDPSQGKRPPVQQDAPLTVLDAAEVSHTPAGRVMVKVPTERGIVELLFSGPQALHAAKHLERAEALLPAVKSVSASK